MLRSKVVFLLLCILIITGAVVTASGNTTNSLDEYYNKALKFMEAKDYNNAMTFLDKCLSIDPRNEKAIFSKGELYYLLKKYDEAITQFDKVIDINPNYVNAYIMGSRIIH